MTVASDRLDATFAALADPTRRAIQARLAAVDATVNELAEPFDMTLPAISKHLKVLERCGLISRARRAQSARAASSRRHSTWPRGGLTSPRTTGPSHSSHTDRPPARS